MGSQDPSLPFLWRVFDQCHYTWSEVYSNGQRFPFLERGRRRLTSSLDQLEVLDQ